MATVPFCKSEIIHGAGSPGCDVSVGAIGRIEGIHIDVDIFRLQGQGFV
jgi:hypothetical protein